MASTAKYIQIVLQVKDEMSASLNSASSGLSSLSSKLTSVGTQMSAAFTVPLVAAGAAAVKMSMDFDKAMKNIDSIAHLDNIDELPQLAQTFKDMSMNMDITTDSAENLAKAYYQVISSGIDSADALDVLTIATKAASAGLTTTEVAVEGIVGTLNAYGLSAEHAAEISDIMFETVNRGVVTFEQLNGALGNVTGLAAQLGVGFDEIGAAVATMTKQNIDAATATTNLNGIFTSLIKPTSEMKEAIAALGYSSGSAMLETLGLGGTLQKLSEYTGGSSEKMAALFGDVRALRGAMALTGKGAGMFAEDLKAMATATGATQEAFAIQMESFAAAWANFQNTLGVAMMEIGDILLPILADLINNYITPLVKWFISLDDTTQTWIVGILAVVAAVGPLLVVLGMVVGALANLVAIVPVVSGAFAAFMALGAPIIALIALVVAAIGLLIFNWEKLGTTMQQIGTIIDKNTGEVFSKSATTLQQLAALVGHAWQEMLGKAGTALGQLGQIIWSRISGIASQMMQLGQAIISGLIKGLMSKAVDLIAWATGMSNDLKNTIKSALGIASPSKVMMELGKNVVQGFHKGLDTMGGIGVNVPSTGGSIQSRQPTLSVAGAGASSGGGSGNVYIENLTVPPGTTQEQIKFIMKEIGKEAARKGAKPTR